MAGVLDLLNSDLGKTIINGVAGQTGQSKDQTNQLLIMALPVLTQAMKRNASTPEGAQSLMNALKDKHDGSILDNLDGLFSGGVNEDIQQDGNKILGHVLGSKQQNITNALSSKSGIDSNSVAQILQVAAPLLLGLLGKQSRQQNISSQNALENMLGALVTNNSKKQEQSFLESILDADGDGSIVDDVADMVLGSNKKKNGLGGLLGGLFGKK